MSKDFNFDSIQIKIPKRSKDSHKGDFGRVLILGGSEGMGGAAILSSEACLYSGAGLVSMYTHPSNILASLSRNPEIMTLGIRKDFEIPENTDVILCGPGLTDNSWSRNIFEKTLAKKSINTIIFDAGAFNFFSIYEDMLKKLDSNIILTPHPGEASKLLDKPIDYVQSMRMISAREISARYKANVILKGKETVVYVRDNKHLTGRFVIDHESYGPQGAYICLEGGPELSTGGTGDVLAGVIAGLRAQKLSPAEACILSVAVHARAGEIFKNKIGEIGLNASSLILTIRDLINK